MTLKKKKKKEKGAGYFQKFLGQVVGKMKSSFNRDCYVFQAVSYKYGVVPRRKTLET